jgi:hypothetical protein
VSLPWFPLWPDRLLSSRRWDALGHRAAVKGLYFSLMLIADRDRESPFCGWVHAGAKDGRMQPFRSWHELAAALDLDHRFVPRGINRLVAAGLIRAEGLTFELNRFPELIHRRPNGRDESHDRPADDAADGMDNGCSGRATTYDPHTSTPSSGETDSARRTGDRASSDAARQVAAEIVERLRKVEAKP